MARAAPFFMEQPVTCNVTRNVFKEPSNEKNILAKITNIDAYKEWGLQGKPFWENFQNNLPVKLKYTYTIQAGCALPRHLLKPRGLYPKKINIYLLKWQTNII
jgi:hypothetical protein